MGISVLISLLCAGLPIDQHTYNPACNKAVEMWASHAGVDKDFEIVTKKAEKKAKDIVVTYTGEKAMAVFLGTAYIIQHQEVRVSTGQLYPYIDSATLSVKRDSASIGLSWGF